MRSLNAFSSTSVTFHTAPSRSRLGFFARLGFLLALLGVVLPIMAGCGDGRPKRVPVSGKVLIDGKPLTLGFVRLIPQGARPATGVIGPDGRFTLATFKPGDGAVVGTHDIAVTAVEQVSSTSVRWHAPKKYANPATAGIATMISGPTDSLLVELSWEGGKPFVERVEQ